MKTLINQFLALAVCICLPLSAHGADPTPVMKAAQEIRIPKVEFRDATLNEAISFLSKKSLDFDSQKKGVNIAVAGKTNPEATITLSLVDAAVLDILKVIAGQVGMEIEPSETILMLVPKVK